MGTVEKVGTAQAGNDPADTSIRRVLFPVLLVPTNDFPNGRIRGTVIPPFSEPGGESIGRLPRTYFHNHLFIRVTSEPCVRKVGTPDQCAKLYGPFRVPTEQVQLRMEQTIPVRDDPEIAIRDSVQLFQGIRVRSVPRCADDGADVYTALLPLCGLRQHAQVLAAGGPCCGNVHPRVSLQKVLEAVSDLVVADYHFTPLTPLFGRFRPAILTGRFSLEYRRLRTRTVVGCADRLRRSSEEP